MELNRPVTSSFYISIFLFCSFCVFRLLYQYYPKKKKKPLHINRNTERRHRFFRETRKERGLMVRQLSQQSLVVNVFFFTKPCAKKGHLLIDLDALSWPLYCQEVEAQWPIGYGFGLRIKRSSIRIRPWPLR